VIGHHVLASSCFRRPEHSGSLTCRETTSNRALYDAARLVNLNTDRPSIPTQANQGNSWDSFDDTGQSTIIPDLRTRPIDETIAAPTSPIHRYVGVALQCSRPAVNRSKALALLAIAVSTAALVNLSVQSASAQDQAPAATEPTVTAGRAIIPAPGVPTKAEAEHVARYDALLKPLSSYPISAEDAALLRDAVGAVSASNRAKAMDLGGKIGDPAASKLFSWFRLKSGYGTADEYRAFLDQNPNWPERGLMTQRLEEALFTQGGSAATIKDHFKGKAPATGTGKAALASALLAEGNETEARRLAADAWSNDTLPATLETGFLQRFSSLLTATDHKRRLDRLIVEELRWSADRKARAAYAQRTIALLPADQQSKAQARLAIFMGGKTPIDASVANKDWGAVYHRAQALRKSGQSEEAAKLLLAAPTDETLINPDSWWDERRANAYIALKAGNKKRAYELVREVGPLGVNQTKEQQFMAGWMAFRLLKEPDKAAQHFNLFLKAADGPLGRAKANYWLGRTAESQSDQAGANTFYQAAAADGDTFHGLLSRQKLNPGIQAIKVAPPAIPTDDDVTRFVNFDGAKAVVAGRKAGLDREIMRSFLVQLRNVFNTESGTAMTAHLADAIGDTQMAVRTGKAAIGARQNMLYYAYPVHPFPGYTALRKPPETAFLLSIARQETEFNNMIVSGAGAKGLLQVMDVTAKHVCLDYKLKCETQRLLTDLPYNAMLASAYIGDRMDDFRGSYILTLASYNAGPGRARQWISENGDPRDPNVDPIDWIERIPIQETREYVAKVLANIQVYRARLGEEATALRLEEDLNRSRGVKGANAGAP
jgi:soluble lytic murein transglycosylase